MTNLSTGKFRRQGAKGKKGYHHGDLRRALIDSALRLARRGGAADVTLRAIARETGVTHMAAYHHFRDREDLLAAVAEEGYGHLEAALRRRVDAAGKSARAQLVAAGVAYVVFAASRPGEFRVMFSADASSLEGRRTLDEARASAYAVLRAAIDRCQAEGLLPEATAAETNALAAWSLVHGLAMLVLDRAVLGPRPARRQVEALALEVIRGSGWRASI
ncbi:MAG: TetR/AcrR family transcriptional regulator [Gemmatimonadales bacterium]|nr:TetR/AcrR family transcriptional regulator [Gemmatimonadales bacterium]